MIIEKYNFYVGTGYVGCTIKKEVEIEFEGNETEEEKEKIIQELFNEWMWDRIESGWDKVED